MAHSYILAFPTEIEAFRQFVQTYPGAILLIDTYDIEKGADNVIQLSRELKSDFQVSGVRLDSGDLAKHAWNVRRKLDDNGLRQLKIFASSSLNEYEIHHLVSAGVPINGFGVGRHLATSTDGPVLDTAYKLVEYAGQPKMKFSESKSTLPGRKQIFRERVNGKSVRDTLALREEGTLPGEPLMIKVMEGGRRTSASEPLDVSRARCRAERSALSDDLQSLAKVEPGYPVELSSGLKDLRERLK